MAYHDVQLPTDIERGAVGGPMFKTTVVPMASGFEQRNIDWSQVRGEWDASYGLMNKSDPDQGYTRIIEFFYARQGRAHSFPFKDWSDYEIGDFSDPTADNQIIGLGDDLTTTFQIFKRYSSGGINYDRDITKPIAANTVVLLDNVVQTTPAQYTLDALTGIITFVTAPASTGGTGGGGEEVVSVACEFNVPVRFDTDKLDIQLQIENAGLLPSIPLVEVRGE
jgi:uncharacterized protein (TIGR02217 family)